MASIGPQLPPHLQKRKRDDEDEESSSPPTKISRPDNRDEIPLEGDDSDDDFGPSAPNPNPSHISSSIGPSAPPRPSIGPSRPDEEHVAKSTAQPIGPSLPPPPTTTNTDEIPLDDSDDDDIGPAAAPSIGPTMPPPAPKRIYGPAPPPADLSERPTTDPNSDSDSDSDSDDGYGPALPGTRPAAANSSNRGPSFPSFQQQQQHQAEEPQAPKRDDWMVAPPTSSSYRAPDPTKLKSRKFASGRSAATGEKSGGVSSIWTETPEEKIKRLAAAVLGREDPSHSSVTASASVSKTSRPKNLDEERVRSYTEQTRGRSLVEEHQAAIAAGKKKLTSTSSSASKPGRAGDKYGKQDVDDEDDPSKRAFDREKDMAVGGRISHTQRKDLLNRAANFGDRFQSGKFL
ncbi:hypothetical protein N0V85_005854 [Neurospora sp. IMI 360204]|nr:hypothetical protein N0V85_005854 [Neurospora sp. IMI 360204]